MSRRRADSASEVFRKVRSLLSHQNSKISVDSHCFVFKKNVNASNPSEHPAPGGKLSKDLPGRQEHWLYGQKLFMVSKGFPTM